MRAFFLLTFIAASVAAFGQVRTPVFASTQDSVTYENLNRLLQDASRNPRYTFRIDSIAKAMAKLREKVVRYRTAYSPSLPSYTRRPADPREVTKLSLVNFKGKSLPDSIYLMTNIAELEIVNSRIQKLPWRLAHLASLKKISLLNNRPRRRLRLGKNAILETLVIHDDEIDRRPRNFRKLPNLGVLDLARNSLTTFPDVKGNARLKRLVLSDNRLSLTDLKVSLPSLQALVLTSNAIQYVPPAIALFPNLTSLDLMVNKVETLPPELERLQHLEQLLLYKNNLTHLPPAVYRLKNLKVIDLYYNQLEQLDTAIRQWKRLEILYVSNNRLFSLPENLGELPLLRELYVHHNRLSALPASIRSLDSIRVLRANENRLLELPSAILDLHSLENLDVSSNQLSTIPLGVFDFPRIKILSIKENPISEEERRVLRARALQLKREREVIIHLEGLAEAAGEN